MSCSVSIQQGSKEPIVAMVTDVNGAPLTGKTDIKIRVRRAFDDFYLDWSDDTFKAEGSVVTILQALVEISATGSPGEYYLDKTGHVKGFDTATITNPNEDDVYYFTAQQDPVSDAVNTPQIGSIRIGTFSTSVVDRSSVTF